MLTLSLILSLSVSNTYETKVQPTMAVWKIQAANFNSNVQFRCKYAILFVCRPATCNEQRKSEQLMRCGSSYLSKIIFDTKQRICSWRKCIENVHFAETDNRCECWDCCLHFCIKSVCTHLTIIWIWQTYLFIYIHSEFFCRAFLLSRIRVQVVCNL